MLCLSNVTYDASSELGRYAHALISPTLTSPCSTLAFQQSPHYRGYYGGG